VKQIGYRVADSKQCHYWSALRSIKVKDLKHRTPAKKSKILFYWGEIKETKNLDFGFRRIASYLLKYRRLNTSAS